MKDSLRQYFEGLGFEVQDRKTCTQILIDGLHVMTLRYKKGSLMDVTFNLIKQEAERKILYDRTKDSCCNFIYWQQSSPVLMNVTEEELYDFFDMSGVIGQTVRLSEFRECQSEYIEAIAEKKDGKRLFWRGNLKTEEHIVKSVFLGDEYTSRKVHTGGLHLTKDDIVLDLGANIGAFAVAIFDKVKQVIAFEPEKVNFQFLQRNVVWNGCENVLINMAAVVGNDDLMRDLWCGHAPYYYSFLTKGGRRRVPVRCDNINSIIEHYSPTKMKVDIEGSEWEVLTCCKDFKDVNEIIFEYNLDMNGDLKSGCKRFNQLKEHLKKHGFDTQEMERDVKKAWNLVFKVAR